MDSPKLSGQDTSHDYNSATQPVSDSPREHERDKDDDTLLGNRGIGLPEPAATTSRSIETPYSAPAPAPAPGPAHADASDPLSGAGDDAYAAYDTGMAGCTDTEPFPCSIAGMPSLGHLRVTSSGAPVHVTLKPWISRGYERDADEYASVLDVSEPYLVKASTDVSGQRTDEQDPSLGKPPIGTRIVGRVERLAGKVLRDPDIEARGKRHMTGHL